MKKSKLYMIIGICVLLISLVGSTYAYYRYVLFDDLAVDTITRGLDYYINYAKGQDITGGTLTPTTDYTEGSNVTVEFSKKDNTYTIYGHIYLDILSIGEHTRASKALKYTLTDGTNEVASGNLYGSNVGDSLPIKINERLVTGGKTYTLYIWIDKNEELDSDMSNEDLSLKLRCEATMKMINYPQIPGSAAEKIVNLYNNADKTKVTNNNREYNYATSVSLMSDGLGATTDDLDIGNIRYYGASPNNYIYFNCDNYGNQTSNTCELWRIIGVFDGKVKIIRNDSIGGMYYNETDTNNWKSPATLNTYLNETYYNELKNAETKGKITNGIWGVDGNPIMTYPSSEYSSEKMDLWYGKIALMNVSDYGYATDFNMCVDKEIDSYNNEECRSNDWLYKGETEWTISTGGNFASAQTIYSSGRSYAGTVNRNSYAVRPALFLNASEAFQGSHTGSIDDPYQLK